MSSKQRFNKLIYAIIAVSFIQALSSFTASARKNAKLPSVITKNLFYITAFECQELDKSFATFSVCSLKPINRTLKLLNVRVILHQPPVTKSTINFRVLKKANGYKPFGMDVNLDICKYFAGKKNPIFDWFYNIVLPYTNINHTCPYYSDMVVENLPLVNIVFPSVFPDGMYRWDLQVNAYDIPRALVKVFLKVDEKDYFVH